ncbi:MAG: efflux RND transporter periplasmic adaptor subunit [Gammaproteobacteria bacterium]|nr:efflux RND transporter periplasmic adaptor subunit [Gammaproteobacteria bacterium]
MPTHTRFHWRQLLIVPPIALGIAVLVWAVSGKAPPTKSERGEPARKARIVEAKKLDLVPNAEGYGVVKPAKVWTAVAQVAGQVVETHPQLHDGEILPRGAVLLRIDPVDYELALAQAQAELAEIDVQAENTSASLTIEQRNLKLTQRDLERKRQLKKQATVSQSTVDEAERTMLSNRTAVQNMNNTLALLPTQRRLLEAKISRAKRDLEHATIRAPFDLRVANLKVETEQYVPVGQALFEGDSVARVEVLAQVAFSSMRRLFIGRSMADMNLQRISENLAEFVSLRPLVRLDLGNHIAEWEAEFVRISDNVDAQTRTIGVVVAVDNPFEKIIPGFRPPLSKGMFVQVLLRGRAQPERIVVPRSAVRNETVYIADADNRLRRRPVRILFNQGILSIIGEGIEPGDRVVVSDLVPAVSGMLLHTEVDQAMAEQLLTAAGAR